MKLIVLLAVMTLSISAMAKNVTVKCEVMSNDDGIVTLECNGKNVDALKQGEKVKVKVKVQGDTPIEGC